MLFVGLDVMEERRLCFSLSEGLRDKAAERLHSSAAGPEHFYPNCPQGCSKVQKSESCIFWKVAIQEDYVQSNE